MEDFRKRLIYLRTTNNLTQKQLADLLNIERSTLSSYEIGRRYPDAHILVKLADTFDVSVDYLLGRENDQNK